MPKILIIGLLLLTGLTATAQKYGHLNFANLLAEMPETAAAEADLKTYNDSLVNVGETMVTNLRTRVAEVEAQMDDLAPKRVAELRVELTEQQQGIARFEQQMGVDINQRRQQLLGPIIEKLRAAVDAVAEEEGYTFIFDTSQFNTLLYARDEDDVMPQVKAKLGL